MTHQGGRSTCQTVSEVWNLAALCAWWASRPCAGKVDWSWYGKQFLLATPEKSSLAVLLSLPQLYMGVIPVKQRGMESIRFFPKKN